MIPSIYHSAHTGIWKNSSSWGWFGVGSRSGPALIVPQLRTDTLISMQVAKVRKRRKRPLSPKMVCLVHYLVIIILPHFPQSSGYTSLTNRMKRRREETRHSSDSLARDAARLDISSASRPAGHHPATRHTLTKKRAKAINNALAVWFPNVHDTRGMPWRKPFDPTLSSEARGQRAYEVCTSDAG